MKKTIFKSALLTTVGLGFFAVNMACPLVAGAAEKTMQEILDEITVNGDSSVTAPDDKLLDDQDSKWNIYDAGGVGSATVVIELAGFAGINKFGIYDINDHEQKVELFSGNASEGSKATLYFDDLNNVTVNNELLGSFSSNMFGFYLDSSAESKGGIFYSNTDLNNDGADHMHAYQGTGDTVKLPGTPQGTWTSHEYILGWEDLRYGVSGYDADYNDFVVMVSNVSPAPEPGTMLLFGTGVAGLVGMARRRKQDVQS